MVNQQAQAAVQKTLDEATKDSKTGVHGISFAAVDKNGDVIAEHASGVRSQDGGDPVTPDTTFYIASCTKFIVTIGVMQLVEQGKIGLDDSAALYKIAPELEKVQVYDPEKDELRLRKGDITLRMLLAHTAGFGYTFFDARLSMYEKKLGRKLNEFTGDIKDITDQPLVNDPNTIWEYGINIDWAGIVLERLTGQSLDEYCKKNIFEPLGLKNTTWFPNDSMRSNIMEMLQRGADGEAKPRKHLYANALAAKTPEEQSKIFQSAGAGSFSRPKEYVQILAALLNGGTSAKTGAQILKPETIETMWENQIPQFPDFARGGPPPANLELANPLPEFYPQEGNPPQGWGLSFFLTIAPGATGRGKNTAWWAGISNQFWWCDREKGVAGMICGQVLPFGDVPVITQWFACETAVYSSL